MAGLGPITACAPALIARDPLAPGPASVATRAAAAGPRQVTTSLADELSPAIDPAGDRLIYVSNQGGNRDIWSRPLAGGIPERLTDHSADDFDPAVAPGSGRLAFASLRRDAKGDIYLFEPGGRPRRLTDRTGADRQPAWSPDGQRLAFTRAEGDSAEAIWELTPGARGIRRLSRRPGFDPAFAPDGRILAFTSLTGAGAEGGHAQPCLWLHRMTDGAEAPAHDCIRPEGFATFARSDGSDWLVFSRFQDDTNGDGRLDVQDRPSLWRQRLMAWQGDAPKLGPAVPLTAGSRSDIMPRVDAGLVYYASRADEDLDIWVLPLSGALPAVLDWADAGRRVAAADPQQALFVLRRCAHDLAGTVDGWRCRLAEAERLLSSGRPGQAGQAFASLAADVGAGEVRERALLGQVAARMQLRLPEGLAPSQQREHQPEANALIAALADLGPLGGRRRLVEADILRRVGRWSEALDRLDALFAGRAGPRVLARANLLRSEILDVLADPAAAEASLLRILTEYRDQRAEVIEAARRLLRRAVEGSLIDGGGRDSGRAVERLEELAQRWSKVPVLPAMIRVEIGDLHRRAGQRELARRAYAAVERRYGDEPEMVAAALLALSDMAEQDGDLSQALDHATELLDRSGADPRQRRAARRRIQLLGGTYAEQLIVKGETGMAIKVYRQLLRQDPNDVVAHRQLIGLLAARGRAAEALAEYRRRLADRPGDDLSLYLVGLCLTYIDPPRHFDEASQLIDQALALNAQAPFVHQTRGWIFEQRHHLLGDEEGLGRAAEAYQTALSLLDARARPRAEADLLLNLGNVFYALGNHRRAYQFYKRRQQREVAFALPERRLVFLEQFGRSALLADELADAGRAFSAAAALARELGRRDRLGRLVASQAAAAQLTGAHQRAAELFERACRLYAQAGQDGKLASCRRNVGYNLYLAGDRPAAARAFMQAEALLRQHGSAVDRSSRVVSVGLGAAASRAAQGFDRRGELDFLFTFESRLYREAGDRDRAARALERKVALLEAELRSGDRAATRLELAISLNHLGVIRFNAGRPGPAAQAFARAGRMAEAAGSLQGALVNLLDRIDVRLSAPQVGSVDALAADLAALEPRLAHEEQPRKLSLARLANAAGVLLVASADQSLATLGAHREGSLPADRLERALGGLDSVLEQLDRASDRFAQAAELARASAGRQGQRLAVLADRNRAEALARQGRSSQAERLSTETRALAERLVMPDLAWRIAAGAADERAEALLGLPPVVSGTDRDLSAIQEQERLLGGLAIQALDEGRTEQAWSWVEQLLLKRRSDGVPLEDLQPATYADRAYLKGLRTAQRDLVEALGALALDANGQVPAAASRRVAAALGAWRAARKPAPDVRPALADLVDARPVSTQTLRAVLEPGEGLLVAMAFDSELAVFLLSSKGWEVNRQKVTRSELAGALAAVAGDDASRASGARSQLSAWLLKPLAKSLLGLSDLVAVTDDLSSNGVGLPLGMLILGGKPLIARMAISHLACASNMVSLRQQRNLNLQRGLWVGSPPDADTATSLKAVLGTLAVQTGSAADIAQAQAESGVVFFGVTLSGDDRRPLRSALVLQPELGALSGLSLSRLATQQTQAGLWVFAAGDGAGLSGSVAGGLELAMAAARVPSCWIMPGATGRKGRAGLLARAMELTGSHSPARALAAAVSEALDGRSSWRELSGVQLRGDGGMGLEARKRYAGRELGGTARQAMLAFRQKRWDSSLRLFLKVRQLAVFLGQTALLPRVDQAIVTSAFQLEEYELAAKVERRILAQAEQAKDAGAAAQALNFLGVLESRCGNYEEAVDLLERAIGELDRLGKKADAAEAQANLALSLDAASRYRASIRAARLATQRFEALGKQIRALAMTRNVGTAYLRRLNMVSAARTWFKRALSQAERIGRADLVGPVLLDQARTELAAGSYDEALSLVGRAEDAFGRAGDPRGKAEASLERAKVRWYRGEYQQAFTAQRQVMAYAEDADDRRLRIMARSLGGLIAMNLGDLEAAERGLDQALAEAGAAGLEDERAAQLNNLGIVARERGDLERALERFEQARRIDEKLKSVGGRAYDLRNIGIVEQMMGRLDAARADLDEALRLSRSIQDPFNEVKTLAGLARFEIAAGRLDAGRQHAEQAYALASRLGLREVAWRALRSMGEIARREGHLDQAREHYARAVELVERMRAGIKLERFRSGFLDNKFDLYEDMIHLLLDMGRQEEAFAYTERARARGFLDLLANRQLEVGGAGDQALLERVRAAKQRVADLTEAARQAEGGDADQAAHELEQARAEADRLLAELRANSPDLTDFVEVRPVEAARIEGWLDARVALVSYYLTATDTLAFVVRADGVRAHRLALPKAELVARVAAVRKLIETFTPADAELRALYEDLVAPLSEDLAGASSVGVLPHDVLHYLPFAALRPGPGRYWADEVNLFSSPSASVLDLLLKREQERFGPAGGLLAVGNPDLGDPTLALPFAEREARALGFEQPGAEVLIGREATEARVKRDAGASAFVHLASHGTFEPASPLQSAIKLAPGSGQDGDLTAVEVFSLPLSARLVTLSACQTGLGKLTRGDEIIGFNRAFLAAGAGGVLSSLWRVSDVATAVLMKRFYRNLKDHPPAEALRLAQELVRRYHPHPAYWAGFVLTGTWR